MSAASLPPPVLISASRRCDIPRYHARWFTERRRAGMAEFRSAFGTPGTVSLGVDRVLGYVFWTRDARPFREALRALRDDGIPYAFQFTINGYGRELEPHRPSLNGALDAFLEVAQHLPNPHGIEWRYDPIVLSDRYTRAYHTDRFERLCQQLAGATRVVNVSVVEPYLKAVRRIKDRSVRFRAVDPQRHRTVARHHPDLLVASEAPELIGDLVSLAAERGITIRVCSNPELLDGQNQAVLPSQCISPELFQGRSETLSAALMRLASRPTRSGCHCLASVDIGMDNLCLSGCKYCYVTATHEQAVANYRRHDVRHPKLRA